MLLEDKSAIVSGAGGKVGGAAARTVTATASTSPVAVLPTR